MCSGKRGAGTCVSILGCHAAQLVVSSTVPISLEQEMEGKKCETSLCSAPDPVPWSHEETVLDSYNDDVGKKPESSERGCKARQTEKSLMLMFVKTKES